MRYIVIGDTHGCLEEFLELLQKVKLTKKDTLILLGDLVHKGPYSNELLHYVAYLKEHFNVVVITGNHEGKHLRYIVHEQRRLETGAKNPVKNTAGFGSIRPNEIVLSVLRESVFTYQFENYIAVHAGIPKGARTVPSMTLGESRELPGKKRGYNNLFTFLRFETEEGKAVKLGREKETDRFWASRYNGKHGHALFGHQPLPDVKRFPHATGLDTGCVMGNKLTALIIENGNETIVQVKAKRSYCETKEYKWKP